MHRKFYFRVSFVLVLALLAAPLAQAQSLTDKWTGTWAAAPFALTNAAKPGETKLGTADVTVREIVHTSIAGSALRVILTNEFGTTPLTVNAAQVGLSTGIGTDGVAPGSAHAVTFGGHNSVIIPAGATVTSDPVAIALPALSTVAISLFVPTQPIATLSYHGTALTTNFIAAGDQTTAASLTGAEKTSSWFLIKSIDVKPTAKNAAAIVCFGDSITDGARSTPDTNHRWPDFLAARLQADNKTKNLGVLDMGIGGNRILLDGTGPSALARFDHDVLALDGVKYLIFLEGINDIGGNNRKTNVGTADDLIWGLTQLTQRAHAHGIKVIGATITPYGKAGYQDDAGEKIRETINNWIRTGGVVDGYVDFEKAVRDPEHPTQIQAGFDPGDHLHFNDDGYKAMGGSIDLNLFK